MLNKIFRHTSFIISLLSCNLIFVNSSQAQQIIPNNDGTMTIVTQDGNSFNLSGGKLSGDGKNLFHSLREFGLDSNQIANFLSNSNIQNILTRINGGNPSIINGLIQVTGGNSNLYLMNPSGIIFGNNASLNVPGSFSATTAQGIGFNGGWFNAKGIINYNQLTGNPTALYFGNQSGVIINAGNLKVAPYQNVSLSGSMVINTGSIETPGGKVNIMAVPGTNKVQITPEGGLLSIEVTIPEEVIQQNLPVSLQDLLVKIPSHIETGLEINDNNVTLTNSNTSIPSQSGTVIVSGNINASDISTTASGLGGEVQIQGKTIGLIDGNIDVSGTNGGGSVLIGGSNSDINEPSNQLADITLVNQNSGINADAIEEGNGGNVVILADKQTVFKGTIQAKGGLNYGDGGFVEISGKENLLMTGDVDLSAFQGKMGTVLFDPTNILIVDGDGAINDTDLGDGSILSGEILGDATISENALENLAFNANVILEADNNITIQDLTDNELLFSSDNLGGGGSITFRVNNNNDSIGQFTMDDPQDTIVARGRNITIERLVGSGCDSCNFDIGRIDTRSETNGGSITISTTGNINVQSLDSSGVNGNGGSINLSAGGNINSGNIISQSTGKTETTNNRGGDIQLTAGGEIDTSVGEGFTVVETTNDILTVPVMSSASVSGDGGNIDIQAEGNIKTPFIASGSLGSGKGGNINITTKNGTINSTSLLELEGDQLTLGAIASASNQGEGGNVNLSSEGDIQTGIIASGNVGNAKGGDVTINSRSGSIDTSKGANIKDISSSLLVELGVAPDLASLASQASIGLGIVTISESGNGGNVNLTASGDITTANIITGSSSGDGGNISLISEQGSIDTTPGRLFTNVTKELALEALLEADVDSTLANDLADLTAYFSDQGIGGLISLSLTGNAGSIELKAEQNITTQYLITSSFSGNAGNLSMISNNGSVTVRNLLFNPSNSISWANLGTYSPELETLVELLTDGVYNVSGVNGGDVILQAGKNIQINTINAQNTTEGEGQAGNVSLTAGDAVNIPATTGIIKANSLDVITGKNFNLPPLNLPGNLTLDVNGNITDGGDITIDGLTAINSNGNDITLDSLNNDFQTVNLGGGKNVTLTDINDLTLANVDSFGNPADISLTGNLFVRVAGTTTINSNIQANQIEINNSSTVLNADKITTTLNQTYNNPVVLAKDTTITGSNITFASSIDGSQSLTVNTTEDGETSFNSNVGSLTPLSSLTTNRDGKTILNGNVSTTGNQNYNDNVLSKQSTVFDANNFTAVSVEGDKNSLNPISLTINALDSVSITGKSTTNNIPLGISVARKINQETGDIIINAENNITLKGAVNTTASSDTSFASSAGNVTLNSNKGDVSVLAVTTFGLVSSGDVKISGDNINVGSILTFFDPTNVKTGNINIQGNNTITSGTIQGNSVTTSGNFTLAENPTILALPNANFARLGKAAVNTINNQNYDNLNLVNNGNLNSIQGKINFTGGVNNNGNDLTISSLKGVNFANQNFTSQSGNLIITTLNSSGEILIGNGNDNQFVITNLDRANGFNNITIGQNPNLGTITISENLTVNDPLTLQASNIFVNNTINGNDNASITLKGAGTTTTLNADIITQGNDITIDDNVIVGSDVTLSTGNSDTGDINILGTINGNNLTLNAGSSDVSLTDNISLNNFSVIANDTQFQGTSITTTGNQNFDSNFTLTENTNFSSQGTFSAQNISSHDTNVRITAQSISSENITTQGGNISLTSTNGGITTENINTSRTTGGSIELNSNTIVNTGTIQTTGSNGNGGDVIATSNNDIEVNSINTSSNNGQGGNVNISTFGRLRVTETIENTDISINATGTNGGGAISINFFPDNPQEGQTQDARLPFVIGNPTSNGTQGIITNGEFSISPDQYFEVVEEGDINLRLLDPQPAEVSNSINTPVESQTPTVAVISSILPISTVAQGRQILTEIERETSEKPAFIYVSFTPKGYQPRNLEDEFARREATNTQEYSRVNINEPNLPPTIALKPAEDDQLDLLVVTNKGEPIRVTVPVTRQQVVDSALNLSIELSSDTLDDEYKPYAKDLYSWLIAPIEETLKEREISNLLFILPLNIRFVPIASLYDEKTEQFLVEKYSSGLAPSLNLNDNSYRSIKDLNLLAMGAAEFAEDQKQTPLPAVTLELPTIKTIWNEQSPDNYQEFLNNNFTLENIKANLDKQPYGIIHFGTHGSFGADENEDIFIQLYNSRLSFKDINSLGLNRSRVELMLLSACQTALGNEIAELGFAGLAVQAGVKSAIGTVWTIGDTGTLAFMTDFYSQLKTQTTKAEALRQTQLNMLNGKVYKSEDGNSIITPNQSVSLEGLPEDSRQREDLSHPFYWAPFTLIGNPW